MFAKWSYPKIPQKPKTNLNLEKWRIKSWYDLYWYSNHKMLTSYNGFIIKIEIRHKHIGRK